jgi:hypothetical protein
MPTANSYASPSTAGGNREYLRDVLTILEPEGAPVTSMIKKGPEMEGTFAEVLADNMRPAQTTGRPEGQDAGINSNEATNRQRFGNYFHILREDFGSTNVQQAVQVAGVTNEYDYQKAKALSQLKRDMEAVICGSQDMQQGSGTKAWQTRGLWSWASSSAQSTNPVPTNFLPPAAQNLTGITVSNGIASLTENQLLAVLQSMFTIYGKKVTFQMIADVSIQAAVDNFTRIQASSTATRYTIMEDGAEDGQQINFTVTSFNTSFGLVHLMPSMFVNIVTSGAGSGLSTQPSSLILNMALLEMQFVKGQKLHTADLPLNAGGQNGYAQVMFASCCKNPKGLARIGA